MMKKQFVSILAITGALGLAVGGYAVAEHHSDKGGKTPLERAASLDTNANGFIEKAEADTPRLTMFAEIDTNGDGGLSFEEMEAHREAKRAERRARRFARQDTNGDGLIGPDEFQARRMMRFDRMDLDGDGAVSLEYWASERRGHHGRGHRHRRYLD